MGIKAVAQNYQIVLESYDQMTVRVEISKRTLRRESGAFSEFAIRDNGKIKG